MNLYLPANIMQTMRNGGRHPASRSIGNNKFPLKAPVLPNIIARATVTVLERMLECYIYAVIDTNATVP